MNNLHNTCLDSDKKLSIQLSESTYLEYSGIYSINNYNYRTYVHSYNITNPDRYRYNNYSAKSNINPSTYKKGTQAHEYTYVPKYNKSYWARLY